MRVASSLTFHISESLDTTEQIRFAYFKIHLGIRSEILLRDTAPRILVRSTLSNRLRKRSLV